MKPFASIVALLLCVFFASSAAAATARRDPIPERDIVFPILNEKAIGDPCQIQYPDDQTPKTGFCTRVRECSTFPLRVFYQPDFNVHRELCYFEIHDPVVCCLSARDAEPVVDMRTQLTQQWPYEFDKTNTV